MQCMHMQHRNIIGDFYKDSEGRGAMQERWAIHRWGGRWSECHRTDGKKGIVRS